MNPASSEARRRDLLLAIFGEPTDSLMAWGRWQRHTDINALTPSEFRLQPALSRRLEAHGIAHPWMTRLRGVYRYGWTANQLTRRDVLDVFSALRREAVEAVAPAGVPSIARLYDDIAGRLGDHVEVLVLADSVAAADAALATTGWRPRTPLPPAAIRSVCGPHLYERAGHRHVRLHWYSAPAPVGIAVNREIFRRHVVASEHTGWVPTLNDVDALILTCVHQRRFAPQDDLIWAADALALLRRMGPGEQVVIAERAAALGVGRRLAHALAELHTLLGDRLSFVHTPCVSAVEDDPHVAILLDDAVGRGGIARAITRARARHAAWCASVGTPPSLIGLLRFSANVYRHDWNAPVWMLPVVALRRLRGGGAFEGAVTADATGYADMPSSLPSEADETPGASSATAPPHGPPAVHA